MKGAVKKSKMERGKEKKQNQKAQQSNEIPRKRKNRMRYHGKAKDSKKFKKKLPSKIVQRKKKDIKDISKATERKANKQRRKETKARRESHEAMQNAKQR